jgi:hypothetical protein
MYKIVFSFHFLEIRVIKDKIHMNKLNLNMKGKYWETSHEHSNLSSIKMILQNVFEEYTVCLGVTLKCKVN